MKHFAVCCGCSALVPSHSDTRRGQVEKEMEECKAKAKAAGECTEVCRLLAATLADGGLTQVKVETVNRHTMYV